MLKETGIAGWKDMEGSEGWERIPVFFAAAGDTQAKPTRVSGGLDLLVRLRDAVSQTEKFNL